MNQAVFVMEDVMDLLEAGDIIGGVLMFLLDSLGEYVFYGSVALGVFMVLYIRYQSITPPCIVLILLFGSIKVLIPTPVYDFSLVIMGLAVGALIYQATVGRRGP